MSNDTFIIIRGSTTQLHTDTPSVDTLQRSPAFSLKSSARVRHSCYLLCVLLRFGFWACSQQECGESSWDILGLSLLYFVEWIKEEFALVVWELLCYSPRKQRPCVYETAGWPWRASLTPKCPAVLPSSAKSAARTWLLLQGIVQSPTSCCNCPFLTFFFPSILPVEPFFCVWGRFLFGVVFLLWHTGEKLDAQSVYPLMDVVNPFQCSPLR